MVALAAAVALAHRAWIEVDPCARRVLPGGHPALEELAFRHDQELRATEGTHRALQSAALLAATPPHRVAAIAALDDDYARRMLALAGRHRQEMIEACRRIGR